MKTLYAVKCPDCKDISFQPSLSNEERIENFVGMYGSWDMIEKQCHICQELEEAGLGHS